MSEAIVFDRVFKAFRRGMARYPSLRDDLIALLTPWSWIRRRETFWALRDLSFAVPQGGALGIIGPNGSGKSTTLKLIARITHPTKGTIRLHGRVGALIEIGAGIHPELTGRENIYMYGSIMGLRAQEIRKKFDRIVDFAGLGEFLDSPLKHYSSGMQVRLGFAVAAHMTTDILLVDEVLAVGDAAFQTKCLRRMRELRDEGVTILLVSHQLANIQRMCPETILLLGGRIAARGPTPEVISAYYQMLDSIGSASPEATLFGKQPTSSGARDGARILAVRLMDAAGRERPEFGLGEDLKVVLEYETAHAIRDPNVSISFNSNDWTVYTGADTKNDGFPIPAIEGRGAIELTVPRLGLGPGLYEVNVGLWDEEMVSPYDWKWGVRRFVVHSTRNLFAGRFVLPHSWALTERTSIVASNEDPSGPRRGVLAASSADAERLNDLQDRLHNALQAFVNGDFVVPGLDKLSLLRPLRLHSCRVPWDMLKPAVEAVQEFTGLRDSLDADGEGGVTLGRHRRWLTFSEAALLLSRLYRAFDGLVRTPQDDGAGVVTRILRRYDSAVYRERRLTTVERFAQYVQQSLAPYVLGVYLHGSLSTLDYTPYSDLDDFIILRRETVCDPDALRRSATACLEASRFLYEHDLLHHHRHYAVTEIDLLRYPPAYLPPETLQFATAILGPTELRIKTRNSGAIPLDTFRQAAQLLSTDGSRIPARNVWHLKLLVSTLLLLPVLYLQTRGTHCYKKFSFDLARPAFDDAWDAIALASELRHTWTYHPTWKENLLKQLVLYSLHNPVLFERLMAKWTQPVPKTIQDRLRETNFYQKVAQVQRKALELVEERAGGA